MALTIIVNKTILIRSDGNELF